MVMWALTTFGLFEFDGVSMVFNDVSSTQRASASAQLMCRILPAAR